MKKIHDVFLYIVISTCYTDEEIAKMVGSENCIKEDEYRVFMQNKNRRCEEMECHYEVKETDLTVYVPKELDHHVAKKIQEDVDLMIDMYSIRCVIFDFSATDFMDSSGIGVLLGRCRKLKFTGGEVVAVNLKSKRVQKIFSMSGLHQLIRVEEEGVD